MWNKAAIKKTSKKVCVCDEFNKYSCSQANIREIVNPVMPARVSQSAV